MNSTYLTTNNSLSLFFKSDETVSFLRVMVLVLQIWITDLGDR